MIEKLLCVFVLFFKIVEIGRYLYCIIDCVICLLLDFEIDIN